VRPDELHGAFNFPFLRAGWDAGRLRTVIDDTLAALGGVGASPTWVLSNHDETRHVTRFGRAHTAVGDGPSDASPASDLALGTRRARAAVLLLLGLPGGAYLFQGEELGLPEVEDLPIEALRDPIWERSGHERRGRDGCRVPLPWSGSAPPFGFGPEGSTPWLPQPASWAALSVAAESGDPASMLELYRSALRLRATHAGLAGHVFRWLPSPDGVLLFERDAGLVAVVNLRSNPVPLPAGLDVLIRSDVAPDPSGRAVLAPDTAAWLAPG
jgi:alpha-glucosidase